MLLEQAAQLPLAHAQPFGQRVDARLFPSSAPSSISASARETVFDVPRQEPSRARFPAGSAGRDGSPPPAPPRRSGRTAILALGGAPGRSAGNRCRSL